MIKYFRFWKKKLLSPLGSLTIKNATIKKTLQIS